MAIAYQQQELHIEQLAASSLLQRYGSPCYVYSKQQFLANFHAFEQAATGLDALICFAVKANSNLAVLSLLGKAGAGADVVSGGELRRALAAGIPAERIVYSGVGKNSADMQLALNAGILQFNVESVPELERLSRVATECGKVAAVAVRVNPDVDAGTHEKIATGKAENKFGIAWQQVDEVYALAARLPGISIQGVDMHIGSQITSLAPYRTAFERMLELVQRLQAMGHPIQTIDIGGGLGVLYPDTKQAVSIADYMALVREVFANSQCRLIMEPGRSLAANTGVLLCQVEYIKQGPQKRFLILDAAMNDLLRPAMYGAVHDVWPVRQVPERELVRYDVVGPVCETGDTFSLGQLLPELHAGEAVALGQAGAYGAVMASFYNTRAITPEVLVSGNQSALIRRRIEVDDQLNWDQLPDF